MATVLASCAVLIDMQLRGGGNPLSLVTPAREGPSVAVFAADFPDTELPGGIGHDGQQFYAIARAPMHLQEVASHLDRPYYRLQHPLLSWLAWLLHPQGGGTGLIFALFAVQVLAMLGGGVALGALSVSLGGPVWLAAAFPLLPGALSSARITGADSLACALAIAALAFAVRSRWVPAIVLAVLAVFAKEAVLLLLVGFALWRRTRLDVALVAVPAAIAAAWAVFLRIELSASGGQVREFVFPFRGLWESAAEWTHGHEVFAAATLLASLAAAVYGLRRYGLSSPWSWAVVVELAFTAVLGFDVIGLNFNGTRTTMPLQLAVLLLLTTPVRGPASTHRPNTTPPASSDLGSDPQRTRSGR
ncbi:MAG: hypothetical protein QOC92_4622 [Acidimicrobiaceae bacterium]